MADGKVTIDTRLDTKGAKMGMNELSGSLLKLGKLVTAAFSVKALVSFGKQAIELASDIDEVQNVVDTAFKNMAYKIEDFAETSIEKFGMSKLSAKQMGSTFMAMASGMGQGLDVASDKAVEITGRLGDIASFYNKTLEQVQTIGKAVYSGETEPLKAIGVIMTETQLATFAASRGYKKLYKDMSASEKLLIRQEYFLEQTKLAAGDFEKTQDSWANQTKILSERWKEFMSIVGSGLIAVLKPLVKTLNSIVASLISIANAIKNVLNKLGMKTEETNSSVSSSYNDLTESAEEYGDAAQAAGKKASNASSSIDELNVISQDSGSGLDGGGGVSDVIDTTELSTNVEEAETITMPWLDELQNRLETIKKLFSEGFFKGFGGDIDKLTSRFTSLGTNINNIGTMLKSIFTDSEILSRASNLGDIIIENFGVMVGSALSVGTTIAEALMGGIEKYLTSNSTKIKEHILTMFDIQAELSNVQAMFAETFSNIFSVFGGENSQQIVADVTQVFMDIVMGVQEFMGKAMVDIGNMIIKPFADNQEELKTTLDDILGNIEKVTGSIRKVVEKFMTEINKLYDEHIGPFVDSIGEGLSKIMEVGLKVWNEYLAPFMDYAYTKISELLENYLSPFFSSVLEALGKVFDFLAKLWNEALVPLITWIMENIVPILVPILKIIFDKVCNTIETIIEIGKELFDFIGQLIDDISEILLGLIDFITGIFTGDWEKAWKGVTEIFEGVKNTIKDIINVILGAVEKLCNGVIKGINIVIDAFNNLSFDIPDWVPGLGGNTLGFNISKLSEISIPRLASGAVIPPNKEFMAVLGDQSNGTNIEAPLTTIQDAVALVLEPYLKALIDNTNTLISSNEEIARKELAIGDREIARANNRGQQLIGRAILD